MEAVSGTFVVTCLTTFMPYYLDYYKDFEELPWPQQDFYQAASEKFGENITEEVFRSCSMYNFYCKEMFFSLPPTSPLFQSNSSVDDIEKAKDSIINRMVKAELWALNKKYVDECFNLPLTLSMHKEILKCDSLYCNVSFKCKIAWFIH